MKWIFLSLFLCASAVAGAQQSKTITEDAPQLSDGIEYGYSVKNVSTREVSKKDFSRYEVTLYAANKSECSRVILFGQRLTLLESEMNTLAKYDCINATGARLTAKTGSVSAKPMYVIAKVNTKDAKGNDATENQKVQIGYYLGAGESVSENVIFIVPLDAKPEVRVKIVNRVSVL